MAVGRSDYKERREDRIDALANKARKANIESKAYVQKSIRAGQGIEFGQPILVGHHSEKRHRAAIKKINSNMEKAVASEDKSEYYQHRAEAAENNNAISGDDPEAVNRYNEKLEHLEALQKYMKSANAYWRKHKTMKGYTDMPEKEALEIDERMKTAYSWVQKSGPYESWRLSNNNAEIRRIKEKLESLKELDSMTAETIKFDGGEMRVNTEINRVQIIFDDIPAKEIRTKLKSYGFKWAPSEGAWQRQRTPNAVQAAKILIEGFKEGEKNK